MQANIVKIFCGKIKFSTLRYTLPCKFWLKGK